MRLWTVHPKYLDSKGLVALWREGLLAQKVLSGKTRGYRHHPQLIRFRESLDPLTAIRLFLRAVRHEALARGYNFDQSKINVGVGELRITETEGQLGYEWKHLKQKLKLRSPIHWRTLPSLSLPEAHPLFHITAGAIRAWEKLV